MKKNLFNLRKGRWLLLMLLSLIFGGGNSAWADAVTDDFTSYDATSSGQTLGDNWYVYPGDDGSYGRFGSDYTYKNNIYDGADANYVSGYSSNYTKNVWLVLKKQISGDVTFRSKMSKNSGTIYVTNKVTNVGDGTFTVDKTNAQSYSISTTTSSNTYDAGEAATYVAFCIASSEARLLDVTYIEYVQASGPALVVKDGSAKLTSPYSYNFGLATAGTSKTFTLSNPGTEATPIAIDVTNAHGFIADIEDNATSIPAGGQKVLTITMPNATANGSIIVTPSVQGLNAFTFNVSGTIRDPNKLYEDFSSGSLPEGWYQSGWTFTNGYAFNNNWGTNNGYLLVSPRISVKSGDQLYFKYMASFTGSAYKVIVKYTTEENQQTANWTNIQTVTASTTNTWNDITINVPSTATYIAFDAAKYSIDDVYGLTLSVGPKQLTVNKSGTSATLTWNPVNTETSWQVYVDTKADAIDNATPTIVSTTPSYTFEGLTPGLSYYAWVRSIFGEDSFSDWSRASFSLTYQSAAPTSIDKNGITNVTFGSGEEVVNSSDRPTSSPFYGDYSSQIGGVTVGQSSNLAITFETGYTYGTVVWVDWNQNYEFEDSEIVFAGESTNSTPTTLDASFTVPVTQAIGYYRMRIAAADSYYDSHKTMATAAGADPNPTGTYTVVHDYTLKVNEASSYAMSISGSDVVNNEIAFGTVKNTTTTKTFTIVNDGGNDLTGVTVTSSDSEVFTVSDTNFDIPVGGSKEITVTFVKAVDGDYNETITISQANVSDQVITVTATYATPTPATMDVTLDDAAVPATVEFGTVGKATTKTFKVANTGEATLNATIAVTGTDVANFTLSSNALEVEGGSEGTFTVTFDATDYDVEKTATITLTAGELNKSFGVTGTRGDFWIEDFEGGAIPEGWDNSGFVVTTGTVGNYPTYTLDSYVAVGNGGDAEKTLITPLLKASAGDKLTFDGFFYYGDETFKVDYSADLSTWNNLYTYDKSSYSSGTTNKIEIESAITGEFYLRFTVNYYNGIDNIVGFKLAPKKEHEAVIEASNIPATGNQYVEYEATVTVKEKAGKDDENVMAELWIGNKKVANTTATLTANGDKVITLTFTPDESMSGDAYIKVYNDNVDLTTGTQAVTISAAPVWSELAEENPFSEGTYTVAVLDYTPKAGWNTIALPFGVSDLTIFGTGVKAFEYNGFSENKLKFKTVTSLVNFTPYLLHVETPVTEDIILRNVSISATGANPSNCTTVHDGVTFQGVYAKTTAGDIYNKHAVTTAGQIGKCSQTATLKAFRAYFDGIPANANARISLDDDDMTTAIESLLMDDSNTDVYNLNGQKIQVPQKGLYIINGKKVVIK